jgi:hypothetical protein
LYVYQRVDIDTMAKSCTKKGQNPDDPRGDLVPEVSVAMRCPDGLGR